MAYVIIFNISYENVYEFSCIMKYYIYSVKIP